MNTTFQQHVDQEHRNRYAARWYATQEHAMNTKYYASPLSDFTSAEIRNGEAGEVEEYNINLGEMGWDIDATVTIIAPKGYELTERDFIRIEELLNES